MLDLDEDIIIDLPLIELDFSSKKIPIDPEYLVSKSVEKLI